MRSGPIWPTTGGVAIRVRVTPKSSRVGVDGLVDTAQGPALGVRVRAVPEDGAANDAVVLVLARWADVAKSRVQLLMGATSRIKSFEISGVALDQPPFSALETSGTTKS